jgi:nicotinate-nucleotide pyrophosphorylase (carboxylating)
VNNKKFLGQRVIPSAEIISAMVRAALAEDIGTGDITAELIPPQQTARAHIITRQSAVICGKAWVDEVFAEIDPHVKIDWQVNEGSLVTENQTLLFLQGPARALLTGERSAINFLQTLSGTATLAHRYMQQLEGTGAKLLDTRKTIPGWRIAQKYAVACGGAYNHRLGLYDAFLIKENHISACGSVTNAIASARQRCPERPVEVEVENLTQLQEALNAEADIILLDNFDLDTLKMAVQLTQGRAMLEASGGVTFDNLRAIAETGVNYISMGSLTKNIKVIDLSMRFE